MRNRRWTLDRTPAVLPLLSLLLLGCPGSVGESDPSDETDVDTDSDTDTAPCEAFGRASFEQQHLPQLCVWVVDCPDSPIASASECQTSLRQSWSATGAWDDCLARECAAWLTAGPSCDEDWPAACNEMSNP